MFIRHGGLVFLVPLKLLEDRHDLLDEGDQDYEGSGCEGPAPADHGPCIELGIVEDVNSEHGARPDDNKQDGEADRSDVGGDLGSPELADDNVKRRAVMEVLHVIQVQLSLILGHPGAQGVVNISCLLPLLLLNLRGHVPPGDVGHDNGEHGSHANSSDVSKQHRDFLSSVSDKGGTREASGECAGQGEPDRHASSSTSNNSADSAIAGCAGPEDGDSDGDHRGGDEDACEVVGPGQVQVDSPAEQAEGDGAEGGDDNAPVLVVEEVLLVFLVLPVDVAGVVGLHNCLAFSSDDGVLLQLKEYIFCKQSFGL